MPGLKYNGTVVIVAISAVDFDLVLTMSLKNTISGNYRILFVTMVTYQQDGAEAGFLHGLPEQHCCLQ